MTRASRAAGPFFATALAALPINVDAQQNVSNTVTINIGTTPGGGYDTYGRIFARHFGQNLPGQPTIVIKNMPGAASLVAANYIYFVAPKDGSNLGMFFAPAIMEPLMGNKEVKFDPLQFSWIGSIDQDVSFCGVWSENGQKITFDDILNTSKEIVFASTGSSGNSFQHGNVLKNLLGAKLRVVGPYAGMKEVFLAMQKHELNGTCALTGTSISSQWKQDLDSGRLQLVIQMGPKISSEFGDVPSVYKYAKTNAVTDTLQVIFDQLLLGRSIAGPPGIDAQKLQSLRDGFERTMKSQNFLGEAKKAQLSIDPVPGPQIENFFRNFKRHGDDVIQSARNATSR